MSEKSRRWPWWTALALGAGLVAAPFAFQMFSRAPKGGHMINAFRPYMTEQKISGFQGDMSEINAAVVEARTKVDPGLRRRFPLYADFDRRWALIDADMSKTLNTMHGDLTKFAAVAALPPFPLFPWFFFVPGLLITATSLAGLARSRRGASTAVPAVALIVLGVGLVVAPFAFRMFTRAPEGGAMIEDFRPLMTTGKVQTIQNYFLVIGAGEGTLRNDVLPTLAKQSRSSTAGLEASLPSLGRFSADWPTISADMAPMIGAMSDNLGNYAAVDALPPFPLFPWFFVLPGVLVVGCAFASQRPRAALAHTNPAISS